ncbi:MAG: GNAT family N-acetyltransferase [Burkholderiales bacterium]|nr:GNAT family N-acetyltransferase [Burkholderiales bacterium]
MVSLDLRLRTDRCTLGCVEESDLEHVWTATRHPGFNDGMLWDAPSVREEMAEWTAKTIELWTEENQYTFTARTTESGVFVGRLVVRPVEGSNAYRIGFWIHPTLWNKGYATELARCALSFAFGELKAETVAVAHAVWNKASARVIEKLGFESCREIAQGFMKRGQWVPELEYKMTRAEWRRDET